LFVQATHAVASVLTWTPDRKMMNLKHLDNRISVNEFLAQFVKGKSVLDVGCVAHTASEEASELWLHRHLVNSAQSVLGIDILPEDIEQLQSRGYNMICADAMTDTLDRKFDVIIVGEVIEHLVNPGGLLTNMRRHLNEGGVLVLTTPNPFYLHNFLHSIFSPERKLWHPDHTSWFDPYVLSSMLRKTDLEMEVCYFAVRSRKLRRLLTVLRLPAYGWMAPTIIAIAKPTPSKQ
jgi:2-polyprenyl-3-methyl-5-hydroxy-6-metoxy-1,4-benzoquinol methylase